VLVAAGSDASEVWTVRTGMLLSSRIDLHGNLIPNGIHMPGDLVGLLETFTSARQYRTTVSALTASTLCRLDSHELKHLAFNHPGAAESIADRLERERDFLGSYGVGMLGQSVKVRLLRLILELRHPYGEMREDGVIKVHLPIPRNILASLVGTTPETMSRVIRDIQEAAIISFDGPNVLIPDLDLILDIVEKAVDE